VEQLLVNYYRLAIDPIGESVLGKPAGDEGFFSFGSAPVCYGRCSSGVSRNLTSSSLPNASGGVHVSGSTAYLPFAPTELIENLRLEKYSSALLSAKEKCLELPAVRSVYYSVRRFLPATIRRALQKSYLRGRAASPFPNWPVDFTVDTLHTEFLKLWMKTQGLTRVPFIWFWPKGAQACIVMTHDVETSTGRDFTPNLMDIDSSFNIRASFQIIPEARYSFDDAYVSDLRNRGFEFNVHDLNHDGHLYRAWPEFLRRAGKINNAARQYGARGFRSGAMYRKPEWYRAFDFSYDMSIPNVARFEPQGGGCCTAMPYFIGKILEIPLTTVEDYSVFHILNEYSIDLWRNQVELILQRNGLISFLAHPDYLIEKRARKTYEELLAYIEQVVERERVWVALPGDVDRWWRARDAMTFVRDGNCWEIEGPGKEDATLAYAVLNGEELTYEFAESQSLNGVRR
jgi:hypothetical protein